MYSTTYIRVKQINLLPTVTRHLDTGVSPTGTRGYTCKKERERERDSEEKKEKSDVEKGGGRKYKRRLTYPRSNLLSSSSGGWGRRGR